MNAKTTPMYIGASVLFMFSKPIEILFLLIQLLKIISSAPQIRIVSEALV